MLCVFYLFVVVLCFVVVVVRLAVRAGGVGGVFVGSDHPTPDTPSAGPPKISLFFPSHHHFVLVVSHCVSSR